MQKMSIIFIKSIKNALYMQQYGKTYLLGQSNE